MAYAFDKVNDLISNRENQNIFSNDQSQAQGGQAQPVATSQPQVKTTTEGELGGASSSSGSSSSGSSNTQGSSTGMASSAQANQAAFRANAGKTQKSKTFDDIGGQLAQNQQNLQAEANKYTQDQTAAANSATAFSGNDIDNAISGDSKAFGKIQRLINPGASTPAPSFVPSKDYNLDDANLLSTDAGLRKLVSRGQDTHYTPGMAAFDLASLRKSEGFDKNVRDLQAQSANLSKAQNDYTNTLPTQAQAYLDQKLKEAAGGISTGLESRYNNLNQQNEAEAKALNDRLAAMRKGGVTGDQLAAFRKSVGDVARKQVEGASPDLINYLDPSADLSPFVTYRDNVTAQDMIDAQEASKFNAIMSLLGRGLTYQAADPLGDLATLDTQGAANELVRNATTAKTEADKKAARAKELQEARDRDTERLKEMAAQRAEQEKSIAATRAARVLAEGERQKAADAEAERERQLALGRLAGQIALENNRVAGVV